MVAEKILANNKNTLAVRKIIVLAFIIRYSGRQPDAVIDDSLGWIPFW